MCKKRSIKSVIAALVLCVCLASLWPLDAGASGLSGITSSAIKDMQEQISNAEKERDELKNSLSNVKKLVAQLEKEKSNLNQKIM